MWFLNVSGSRNQKNNTFHFPNFCGKCVIEANLNWSDTVQHAVVISFVLLPHPFFVKSLAKKTK